MKTCIDIDIVGPGPGVAGIAANCAHPGRLIAPGSTAYANIHRASPARLEGQLAHKALKLTTDTL